MGRDYSCEILLKNVAVFIFVQKNLTETKLKSVGLMTLGEKIARQPTMSCILCLLVVSPMQIHNEMEQVGQGEIKYRQY